MSRRHHGREAPCFSGLKLPIVCTHHEPDSTRIARLGTVEYWPEDGRVHVDTDDAFNGADDPFASLADLDDLHLTWPFRCRKCGVNRPLTNKTLELVVPFYVQQGLTRIDVCTVDAVAATLRKQ